MDDPADDDTRKKIEALQPEDREFLEQHGWRDTTTDYPTIETERIWQ